MADGHPRGSEMVNPELWILDRIFPLAENPHALTDTLRSLYKILLPFIVLILVCLITCPTNPQGSSAFSSASAR